MRLHTLLLLLLHPIYILVTARAAHAGEEPCPPAARRQAYVSLLYGEQFVLGARVLGRSIQATHTCRDMVLMVTGELSDKSEQTLETDGWKLQHVNTIHNPGQWTRGDGQSFPARFWAVYSKLALFNLTQYDKVVFLDSDALAVRNIDELFSCPGFCAALRHSERLNSGVMAVTPDSAVFDDMLTRVATTPSYTGGEQGFLAEYFQGFAGSLLFNASGGGQHYPEGTKCLRLPTGYNADLGLYLLNNGKWSIPKGQLAVIHYTLGGFKPWDWWTTWLVDEAWRWQAYRYGLPQDAWGMAHGETRAQVAARWLLLPLPLVTVAVLVWWALCCHPQAVEKAILGLLPISSSRRDEPTKRVGSPTRLGPVAAGKVASECTVYITADTLPSLRSSSIPSTCITCSSCGGGVQQHCSGAVGSAVAGPSRHLYEQAVAAGFTSIFAGLVFVVAAIPRQTWPEFAWVMAAEWLLVIVCSLFGCYLCHCYRLGVRCGGPPPAAPARRPVKGTVVVGLGVCLLLLLLPCWGLWLSSGLVRKVLVTAVAAALTCVLLSQAFAWLALLWWEWGAGRASQQQQLVGRHKGW